MSDINSLTQAGDDERTAANKILLQVLTDFGFTQLNQSKENSRTIIEARLPKSQNWILRFSYENRETLTSFELWNSAFLRLVLEGKFFPNQTTEVVNLTILYVQNLGS